MVALNTSDTQTVKELLVISGVLASTFAVFGLVANALLVYSVTSQPNLRRSPTFLALTSLALSDILLLTTAPLFLLMLFSRPGLPPLACSAMAFIGQFGVSSSSFHITAFSVLRYFTLVKPLVAMKYLTIKATVGVCLLVWTIALVASAGLFFIGSNPDIANANISVIACIFEQKTFNYLIALSAGNVFLPMLALVAFHIAKVYNLKNRPAIAASGKISQVSLKIVIVILVMFGLSSFPSSIYWSILVTGSNTTAQMQALGSLLSSLNYMNSAINPIVYFFFSGRVREKICFCRRRKNTSEDRSNIKSITAENIL